MTQLELLNFHKVVQQHTEGMVGSIICILLEIYFSFQQWKKFKNPLRTDKVIAMSLVYYFFGTQCSKVMTVDSGTDNKNLRCWTRLVGITRHRSKFVSSELPVLSVKFFQFVQHVRDADLGVWTLQTAVHPHVYKLPDCHVTRHVWHDVAAAVVTWYLHRHHHHHHHHHHQFLLHCVSEKKDKQYFRHNFDKFKYTAVIYGNVYGK